MKRLFQILLVFMLMLTIGECLLFSGSRSKSKVTFFAPRSLYIYVMGSYNHFSPPEAFSLELGIESADAFTPVLGIGYRIVNIKNRTFVTLEGDYSPAKYNFGDYARNQKISTLTFMLNVEENFSPKSPLMIFAGVGVVIHGLSDLGYVNYQGDYVSVGDDNITAMALDVGIKIPISRHLMIRSEFQWNGEVNETYSDYYGAEGDDTQWDFLSSSLSVGIEFHF